MSGKIEGMHFLYSNTRYLHNRTGSPFQNAIYEQVNPFFE